MAEGLSERLARALEALPLRAGSRVLEIGCGPGALARAIAERVGPGGFVLGLDRSARAIAIARRAAAGGRSWLAFREGAIEDFTLASGEPPFDLALALRVGALDGRHPRLESAALARIAAALGPGGRLLLDGGDPLREGVLPGRARLAPPGGFGA
jgi:SAM-dependent methyltransferase